jgi:adenylosuccinate lyase
VQEVKKGEIGSSTMPQKVNPIRFENSEGNIQMANSIIQGLVYKLSVSRLQRDLSDSTSLRNLGVALGHGLLAYNNSLSGLKRIKPNFEQIDKKLNENWAILTEGVQTVLRKAGVKDPYSLIVELTRGKNIGAKEWKNWIDSLLIADDLKTNLKNLSPQKYLGQAEKLTEIAIKAMS